MFEIVLIFNLFSFESDGDNCHSVRRHGSFRIFKIRLKCFRFNNFELTKEWYVIFIFMLPKSEEMTDLNTFRKAQAVQAMLAFAIFISHGMF